MTKVRIVADLDYDDKLIHGDDLMAKGWFYEAILQGENLVLHDNGDIGDDIGKLTVNEIHEYQPTPLKEKTEE